MNGKWVRIILIATLATIIAMQGSSPAFAKAPEKYAWDYDLVDNPLFDCGDFWIIENSHATIRGNAFFDNDGNLLRQQTQFTYDGTLANSVTGKVVTDAPDHQTYVFFPDGSFTIHGLVVSINIPGTGTVGLDAGSISFDPDGNVSFRSGPHHLLTDGFYLDYTVVCDALR